MYFTGRHGERVGLTLVAEETIPRSLARSPEGRRSFGLSDVAEADAPMIVAARAHFGAAEPKRQTKPLPKLPLLRDDASGQLRTVYKEIVVRFAAELSAAKRNRLLKSHRLKVARTTQYVSDQFVVDGAGAGLDLFDPANELAQNEEVIFAVPNFVSEYRRTAASVTIPTAQWHLDNRANRRGQRSGEDVDAREAWRRTRGRRSVVVAVVDDGVDIDHPNLKARIWRNPDTAAPDRHGRDFFVADGNPEHFNPRPKKFAVPFDVTDWNDIHGTPCAGVIAALGDDAWGVAPRCRILPVKIFHADEMAADERVADAIRYSATKAAVISCSFSGPRSEDVALAIEDAGPLGRGGLGSPVLCATGNDGMERVGFPAADPHAIAVGASTDRAEVADYSNHGPEVAVVAPSNGGVAGIYTTDVSIEGRGYNLSAFPGGMHTDTFGGTSSATPLAAGVAALVITVNPKLTRDEVRDVLQTTAEKIGEGYATSGPQAGHSIHFGYGRVDADAAVAEAIRRRR